MSKEALKQKIAALIKDGPGGESQPVVDGKDSSSVVDTNIDKDASFKKGLDLIMKGVVRGSNFLSSVPERVANSAKIQVFGGRELARLAGPFSAPKALKDAVKSSLKRESIFKTGLKGQTFKSATKNVYVRGEKIEGTLALAKNIFNPKDWKEGLNQVFKAVPTVAGKKVSNKGAQRAVGFLANNPMDIALTAIDYNAANTRKEKNEVLMKGVPTFMLTNTMSNLGGKRYSLMSNLVAGALAHRAVDTAWKAGKKVSERKNKNLPQKGS
tara:strand:+ start:2582 stop:3388 length:807 start_codon:yes stop_codon:yes gene_type:complete